MSIQQKSKWWHAVADATLVSGSVRYRLATRRARPARRCDEAQAQVHPAEAPGVVLEQHGCLVRTGYPGVLPFGATIHTGAGEFPQVPECSAGGSVIGYLDQWRDIEVHGPQYGALAHLRESLRDH